MARRCPGWIAREDLVSAGILGLTEAAARYDLDRKEPFLAFAEKRIRGAVLDELRLGDILPRRVRQRARKIGRTIKQLEQEGGTPPTDVQLAAKLGVSLDDYRVNLELLVHVAVGALETSGDIATHEDSSPEYQASQRQTVSRVRRALEGLEPRDLLVLSLYYRDGLKYSEISRVLNITTSRICQLHGRAIARLRTELARLDTVRATPFRRA